MSFDICDVSQFGSVVQVELSKLQELLVTEHRRQVVKIAASLSKVEAPVADSCGTGDSTEDGMSQRRDAGHKQGKPRVYGSAEGINDHHNMLRKFKFRVMFRTTQPSQLIHGGV